MGLELGFRKQPNFGGISVPLGEVKTFNNRFIPMRALEESHAICFILMVYYAKNISLAREYSNADETTLQAGGVEG